MNKPTITFADNTVEKAINWNDKKEMIKSVSLVVIGDDNKMKELVSARWYIGRAQRGSKTGQIIASVWIYDRSFSCSGSAIASGHGYNKEKGALQGALNMAGVNSDMNLEGCHEEQIFYAVGRALGYADDSMLVVRHG